MEYHPTAGRLSRSQCLHRKKNAIVQFTDILIIRRKGVIYCDVLDFLLVGTNYDDINY